MSTESFNDPEIYEIDAEEYVNFLKLIDDSEDVVNRLEKSINKIHEGKPIQYTYECFPEVEESPEEILFSVQIGNRAYTGKVKSNTDKGNFMDELRMEKEELDEPYYPAFSNQDVSGDIANKIDEIWDDI